MSNMEPTRVMGVPAAGDRTLVSGGQATMVMPGQPDASRTQMGGTTICPVCGTSTPLMDPFCGDCGFLLESAPAEPIVAPTEDAPAGELLDQQSGRRFRLRNGVNTVGRHGTDILVNEGTVSRNHARITLADGGATVEDLGSSNGTKVGDQRLTANQPVSAPSGVNLRFGNWNVVLEIGGSVSPDFSSATIAMPAPDDRTLVNPAFSDEDTFEADPGPAAEDGHPGETSAPVAPPVSILRKIAGPSDDIPVAAGTLTLGRRPENDIVLSDDAYVSGRHAELFSDGAGTYVTDVGSTNGTVVNGQRIPANARIELTQGDELHIGQNHFRLESLQPAPDGEPLASAPAEGAVEPAADGVDLDGGRA